MNWDALNGMKMADATRVISNHIEGRLNQLETDLARQERWVNLLGWLLALAFLLILALVVILWLVLT